jgi:hypothetical protein
VSETGQVAGNLGLEYANQFRVHELVLVRDVQADDTLVAQVWFELGRQLRAMGVLHDKDKVSPLQKLRRNRTVCVEADARGGSLDAGPISEYLLRGRTAQAILSANEKDVARQELFLRPNT